MQKVTQVFRSFQELDQYEHYTKILKEIYEGIDVSKAKPCPFCGSKDIGKILDIHEHIVVYCKDCDASSGYGDNPLEKWNRRVIFSQ